MNETPASPTDGLVEHLTDLLDKATPLPWREQKPRKGNPNHLIVAGPPDNEELVAAWRGQWPQFSDTAYILAAVNALPDLLRRLQAVEAERDEARKQLGYWETIDVYAENARLSALLDTYKAVVEDVRLLVADALAVRDGGVRDGLSI